MSMKVRKSSLADTRTPVDRAYNRYEVLSNILERIREQALTDPMHRRNVDLGLTEPGRDAADDCMFLYHFHSGLN